MFTNNKLVVVMTGCQMSEHTNVSRW